MNIKAIASRIGMDYDNVIENFCGDTSEVRKKLESFIDDCNFTALESAIEANDEEQIKKCAHKIRKTGEKLGLTNLVKQASLLEDAKNGKIAPSYDFLRKEYLEIAKNLTSEADV